MKKICLTVVALTACIGFYSNNLLGASKSSVPATRYKCHEGYQIGKKPSLTCPGHANYVCSYTGPTTNLCMNGNYSADWHGIFWCTFPDLTSEEVFALNFECPEGYSKPMISYDEGPVSILCYLDNYEEEMKSICSGDYKATYHSGKDWCCVPK